MRRKIQISDDDIIRASRLHDSAATAAASLNLQFSTYKRHATRLGVYITNQGSKGRKKPKIDGSGKIPLSEIFHGLHPQYQTNKLRIRLFDENIKSKECENCRIREWNGKPISFECDHVNGNSKDHRLENLKILCPNCHSQTDTYRGKNKSRVW